MAATAALIVVWLICRLTGAPQQSVTAWIRLALWGSLHGWGDLAQSSRTVTAAVTCIALLGAALRVVGYRPWNGQRALRQLGLFATCAPLAILLPISGAWMYLVAAALIAGIGWGSTLRQGTGNSREPWWRILARESFSVLSAACFLGFGWEYNAQLLTRALLVAGGISLITQALVVQPDSRSVTLRDPRP